MKLPMTVGLAVGIAMAAWLASNVPSTTTGGMGPFNAPAYRAACGCNDAADLTGRLKGVDAVIQLLAAEARGPNAGRRFDANTFDQELGEAILLTLATSGGISSMVIADIDRSSCDLITGANLNVPGVPAGLAGSACLGEASEVQLNVRRRVCTQGRTPANQGNDYWEDRRISDIVRELSDAYTAEGAFIRAQLARLQSSCSARLRRSPSRSLCPTCLWYMFEASRTLPIVGRMRMWADEVIPFTVGSDNSVSGDGTINTILDMSGSPCTVSGYNGVAEFQLTGRIDGDFMNVTITPKGASQRTSAAMSIRCPPGGKAEAYPQQQFYTVTERLRIPGRGQDHTDKIIDLGARTGGAMQGEILLRLKLER